MRKAKKFFFFILVQGIFLIFLLAHSFYQIDAGQSRLKEKKQMVRDLELTDLCLFTEANYTRHLTQADHHTAFQNSPCPGAFPFRIDPAAAGTFEEIKWEAGSGKKISWISRFLRS
jgi:hypothetical protein